MNKKDLAYAVILAGSVFSISILLFSKGITSVSVAIGNGDPVAIATPKMYPLNEVILMLALSAIATNCFSKLTCIGDIKYELIKSLDSGNRKNNENLDESQINNRTVEQLQIGSGKTVKTMENENLNYFEEEPSHLEFEENVEFGNLNNTPWNIKEEIEPLKEVEKEIKSKFEDKIEKIDKIDKLEKTSTEIKKEDLKNQEFKVDEKKLKNLKEDELKIYNLLYDSENKELLQNKIVLETGFSKVKVSRTIRKLELYGLIVRKPYGNTNRISLKGYNKNDI
ncbi:DUF7343 domain-containing protein [Methanococcus voltae]|uniref:Putative membrane protein n=1 Tax=Methanococcus voltae TaxID=2188 RepID=A0A8J7S5G6_METVO|nr:hypothetical protein [Methanococcus voltae]MBP2172852.1 putative membrane protein [Methanococcus voltae]MBP2201738.1 putative membrane protein [Methanococcus voltae]